MREQEWKHDKPPKGDVVEVRYFDEVIRVRAIWGCDGIRPHWASEDGNTAWDPAAFKTWRWPAEVQP